MSSRFPCQTYGEGGPILECEVLPLKARQSYRFRWLLKVILGFCLVYFLLTEGKLARSLSCYALANYANTSVAGHNGPNMIDGRRCNIENDLRLICCFVPFVRWITDWAW